MVGEITYCVSQLFVRQDSAGIRKLKGLVFLVIYFPYIPLFHLTLLVFSTITTVLIWCGFQFVDVERTAVSHLYICTILTTTVTTVT